MKYLCLIYDDEQQWQKFPKEVQDKYMGEYGAFTESIKKSGKFVERISFSPPRPPPPCARATEKSRLPMARSPRRRNSSVATT